MSSDNSDQKRETPPRSMAESLHRSFDCVQPHELHSSFTREQLEDLFEEEISKPGGWVSPSEQRRRKQLRDQGTKPSD